MIVTALALFVGNSTGRKACTVPPLLYSKERLPAEVSAPLSSAGVGGGQREDVTEVGNGQNRGTTKRHGKGLGGMALVEKVRTGL